MPGPGHDNGTDLLYLPAFFVAIVCRTPALGEKVSSFVCLFRLLITLNTSPRQLAVNGLMIQ